MFAVCFCVLVSFCFLWKSLFSLKLYCFLGLFKKVNLFFSFQFLVLDFCSCFVCFLFQDAILFCVMLAILFCFQWQYYICFCILISCCCCGCCCCCCCCFCFCCFDILLLFWILAAYQKHLSKIDIPKDPKMENAAKTDILTRAVSTSVFTNSVFFLFLCVFKKLLMLCWKHNKE